MKFLVDLFRNNQRTGQDIVAEEGIEEHAGAIAFARVIQIRGKLVADDNRLPVEFIDTAPQTEAALTVAGATTPPRNVAGYRYYSYHVVVTGIGTSLVLRMEGTHLANPTGDTDWYSLQSDGDVTISANGSYKFQISGETDLQVRMNLVSFNGGTPSAICTLIRGV